MNLRAALLAVQADSLLDLDDLPPSLESLALIDGLIYALENDLAAVTCGGFRLTDAGRAALEDPSKGAPLDECLAP